MTALRVNPVLERELRERMRTTGAVVLLTLYLALMVGVFLLVYKGQSSGSGFTSTIAPTEVARVGRGIFETVLFLMSLLVLFIVPGYTAAAIAGERERQSESCQPNEFRALKEWNCRSASRSRGFLAPKHQRRYRFRLKSKSAEQGPL